MVPGAIATLNIKTESNSLCSVSAVDRSMKFLSSNHDNIDVKSLSKPFMDEIPYPTSGRKTCVVPTRRNSQGNYINFQNI